MKIMTNIFFYINGKQTCLDKPEYYEIVSCQECFDCFKIITNSNIGSRYRASISWLVNYSWDYLNYDPTYLYGRFKKKWLGKKQSRLVCVHILVLKDRFIRGIVVDIWLVKTHVTFVNIHLRKIIISYMI